MSLLIPTQSSAHWYSLDGKPQHTIVGANGKKRDTTLRDARKNNWAPSVTSVLSVIGKPALTAWISEQAILAALTLPRDPKKENDQDFAARCVKDMDAQRDAAGSLGTQVHHAVDQVLTGQLPDPAMACYVAPVEAWLKDYGFAPVAVESDYASKKYGFGGRIDLYAKSKDKRALLDFKTQKAKGGKFNFYDTWPVQLAAYRQCLIEAGETVDACYSIAIDTGGTGLIEAKLWTPEETDFDVFKAALKIWQYQRGYKPV